MESGSGRFSKARPYIELLEKRQTAIKAGEASLVDEEIDLAFIDEVPTVVDPDDLPEDSIWFQEEGHLSS